MNFLPCTVLDILPNVLASFFVDAVVVLRQDLTYVAQAVVLNSLYNPSWPGTLNLPASTSQGSDLYAQHNFRC
jgi:hypothetical protein